MFSCRRSSNSSFYWFSDKRIFFSLLWRDGCQPWLPCSAKWMPMSSINLSDPLSWSVSASRHAWKHSNQMINEPQCLIYFWSVSFLYITPVWLINLMSLRMENVATVTAKFSLCKIRASMIMGHSDEVLVGDQTLVGTSFRNKRLKLVENMNNID